MRGFLKKAVVIILVLAVLIVGAVFAITTANNYAEWQQFVTENSILGYAYYIKNNSKSIYTDDAMQATDDILVNNLDNIKIISQYIKYNPDGKHIDLAIDTLDDLKWTEALEVNEVYQFYNYINYYPNGKYISEAREKVDYLRWHEALSINHTSACYEFISKYPDSKYIDEAYDKIDDLFWAEVLKTNDTPALGAYISNVPDGKHIDEAYEKFDDLYWDLVMNAGNTWNFEDYISQCPNGKYVDEAYEHIETINWMQVVNSNSIFSFENFMAMYPNSKYAKELKSLFPGIDITTLAAQGKIHAVVNGSGIDKINISITNNTDESILVNLPFGTWFESDSESGQNMLLAHKYMYYLSPRETKEYKTYYFAYMDINCSIPNSDSSFSKVNSLGDDELLTKVLKALFNKQAEYPLIQAAVWRITDNATNRELMNAILSSGASIITEEHIAQADEIIENVINPKEPRYCC